MIASKMPSAGEVVSVLYKLSGMFVSSPVKTAREISRVFWEEFKASDPNRSTPQRGTESQENSR